MKQCTDCHQTKSFSEFNPKGNGYCSKCRECGKLASRMRYERNREAVLAQMKQWYLNNREHSIKANTKRNRTPKARARQKIYFSSPEYREKARASRAKWLSIPHNRIANALRGRISKGLKGIAKSADTEKLLGVSFEALRAYLETQFAPGMAWQNYGKWHIDHIIPIAFFDFTDHSHQRVCFHYMNLRPIWAGANFIKNDALPENYQELLESISRLVGVAS